MPIRQLALAALAVLLLAVALVAQDAPAPKEEDPAALSFMAYDPPSTLVVPQHPVARARYPFVDVHSHQFELDSDKIMEVSHDLLNEVAKVIKDNPQLKKIEVEGHASAEGSDAHNLSLSKRRAKSVLKYLTANGGVDKGLLSSKGYGETRPIADNETEEGREKNRRVEFMATRIVETIQPAAPVPGQTAPANPAPGTQTPPANPTPPSGTQPQPRQPKAQPAPTSQQPKNQLEKPE